MKKYYAFALMIVLTIVVFAAEFTFDVKTANGDIQVQKGGKGSWQELKAGTKLNNGDQLKIASGAILNLVHNNGNPIEVSKSGNYSVEKLAAQANTKKSDVTKKFTNYLLDELGESEDLLAEDDLSDNMSTLGAVERAIPKFSPNDLIARMPRSSYATENNVTFSWHEYKGIQEYTFVIKNDIEETVLERKVKGTEIKLDLEKEGFEKGFCYYWSVKAGDQSSEELCIYRMIDEEKSAFTQELNTLRSELDESKALDNMILASFYSENKVVPEAIKSYEKAIELAPNVDSYKLIYGKYLMSIGLAKDAKGLAKK